MKEEDKPALGSTWNDVAAALTRGAVSTCPVIGGILAELVGWTIPNQRADRIAHWLTRLDHKIQQLDGDLHSVESRLGQDHGSELFEESATQAARAPSSERREYLANLMARCLTQEELKYAEARKLLNLFRELTDPEIIMLIYYSKPLFVGSEHHQQMAERYPETLDPASTEIGASQQELDRAALQEGYINTLSRAGLVSRTGEHACEMTGLGRLLLRYIWEEKSE